MNTDIKNRMSAIENIIREQAPDQCRRNVFETINILIKQYPDDKDEIESSFIQLCNKLDVDFYQSWKETFS